MQTLTLRDVRCKLVLLMQETPCVINSKKGAHAMYMFYSTTLVFNPDFAGALPDRSAPIDH